MPREKIEIWRCDLCSSTLNITTNGQANWKAISVEDKHMDRSFSERIVCYSCITKINQE